MRTLTTTTQPLPPPTPQCFLSSLRSASRSSLLFTTRPKQFLLLPPCSSVKGAKKQTAGFLKGTTTTAAPQSLRRFLNPKGDGDDGEDGKGNVGVGGSEGETAVKGTLLAALFLVAVVGGFGFVGYIYKDQINGFLTQFSRFIEGHGAARYAFFVAVYARLEVAAAVAFLIARYFARERILKLVEGNKKFLAIDKAIGENGFKVVTLLRLSPLLPFSLGNYLYGLTSVKFVPYVFGSWLGMLPGTWAYVSAGAFGRALIQEESEFGLPGGNNQLLTLGLGLLATAIAAAYVTRLAKDAIKDIE